jgi:hypothetical protein
MYPQYFQVFDSQWRTEAGIRFLTNAEWKEISCGDHWIDRCRLRLGKRTGKWHYHLRLSPSVPRRLSNESVYDTRVISILSFGPF